MIFASANKNKKNESLNRLGISISNLNHHSKMFVSPISSKNTQFKDEINSGKIQSLKSPMKGDLLIRLNSPMNKFKLKPINSNTNIHSNRKENDTDNSILQNKIESPRIDFKMKFFNPNHNMNIISPIKKGKVSIGEGSNDRIITKNNSIIDKLIKHTNFQNYSLKPNENNYVNKGELFINQKYNENHYLKMEEKTKSLQLTLTNNSGSMNHIFSPKNNNIDEKTPKPQNNIKKLGCTFYSSIINTKVKKFEAAKYGSRPNGWIIGYGANTNQGRIRNYNEDRVSIIYNVLKPNSRKSEKWPSVSFFGIYDGHAGNKCADFLKDNLHQYIFRQDCFPKDPLKAIKKGFEEAEKIFISQVKPTNVINDFNRSGSCAIILIIMDDNVFIGNLGDSRALLSEASGKKLFQLTRDHKPNDPEEKKRVEKNGGYIYQNVVSNVLDKTEMPWRIFPGKLSVNNYY